MNSLPPLAWLAPIAFLFVAMVGLSVLTLMRWREDLRNDPSTYECPSTAQDIAGGNEWPTVVGKLVDERTGEPIASASVGIGPNGGELVTRTVETDMSGHFKVGGVGLPNLNNQDRMGSASGTVLLPAG